jgi:DNA-binding NarL/FixJ family response regulator
MMLKGLAEELNIAGYKIVGLAENGAKALQIIAKEEPTVAILDVEMPLLSGFEVIEKCKLQHLNTRLIIMTYHKTSGFLVQARKCGANGYLLKEDGLEEIETCIKTVLNGEFYYSKSLDQNIEGIIDLEIKKIKTLTPSERSILRMIAVNKNSKDIAKSLDISKRTVEKHRSNIINKLDLENKSYALPLWISNHKELIKLL